MDLTAVTRRLSLAFSTVTASTVEETAPDRSPTLNLTTSDPTLTTTPQVSCPRHEAWSPTEIAGENHELRMAEASGLDLHNHVGLAIEGGFWDVCAVDIGFVELRYPYAFHDLGVWARVRRHCCRPDGETADRKSCN